VLLISTVKKVNSVSVVYVRGPIHFGEESASLRFLIKSILANSSQIVLDLGGVTHMDSGGVGTLVGVYASARKVGADIKFANLGANTSEVLQVTRFVSVFEIFEKTEDAIASFNS
jgi:anti-sigma B factor antagonist